MKTKMTLLVVSANLFAAAALAQDYSIDWFAIAGGGGTSTGDGYSVSGTIGQPDSGQMSGEGYTLDGGFWGNIAAVQTPGAPTLRIFATTTNTVIVAWPAPTGGFTLQQHTNLATTNWVNVTNATTVVGSENLVTVSPQAGNRFYRLISP